MMPKLFTITFVGLTIGFPLVANAQDSEYAKTFWGIGTGSRGRGAAYYGQRFNTIGFQLGMYNDIDLDSNQLVDGPPPNDAQYLGNYRTDPGFGADLLLFPETGRQSVFFGVGLYYEGYTMVGRSSSSGLLYDFGHRNIWRTGYSVGLHASVGRDSDFGMGYHNLLGWNISLTVRN